VLEELVPGSEGVERHVAIGQQVLAPLLGKAHCVGKDLERIHLCKVLNRIKRPALDEPINETDRLLLEGRPQLLHGRGREDAGQHRAGPGMERRIGLEDETRWPPRRLLPEVAEPDARRGAKGLPVQQAGADLLVAGHGPDTVPVEPDHGSRLPQLLVEGIGVGEKLVRKGIAC
jgi:hypothetical protein